MRLDQQTQVELVAVRCTAALRPSLAFARRARGTLPFPDSSQWEPSPPLWAPHLPSLAGPHAPHLLSLALPLPWLCSTTSVQVSAARGQGAAQGPVFEGAAWEGSQAGTPELHGDLRPAAAQPHKAALLNVMYPSRDRLLHCPRRWLSLCMTTVPPLVSMSHTQQSHPAQG